MNTKFTFKEGDDKAPVHKKVVIEKMITKEYSFMDIEVHIANLKLQKESLEQSIEESKKAIENIEKDIHVFEQEKAEMDAALNVTQLQQDYADSLKTNENNENG